MRDQIRPYKHVGAHAVLTIYEGGSMQLLSRKPYLFAKCGRKNFGRFCSYWCHFRLERLNNLWDVQCIFWSRECISKHNNEKAIEIKMAN